MYNEYCEQVIIKSTEYRAYDNTKLIVRAGRKTGSDSDEGIDGEPIIHVGQDKLFPHGNCIERHGCTVCTRWEDCTQCDDYHLSKRKRKYKKRKQSEENEIISDVEKLLLKQFRGQDKWQDNFDAGPI
jgi:hypothetical protein